MSNKYLLGLSSLALFTLTAVSVQAGEQMLTQNPSQPAAKTAVQVQKAEAAAQATILQKEALVQVRLPENPATPTPPYVPPAYVVNLPADGDLPAIRVTADVGPAETRRWVTIQNGTGANTTLTIVNLKTGDILTTRRDLGVPYIGNFKKGTREWLIAMLYTLRDLTSALQRAERGVKGNVNFLNVSALRIAAMDVRNVLIGKPLNNDIPWPIVYTQASSRTSSTTPRVL